MHPLRSIAGAAFLSTLFISPMWDQDPAPAKPPEPRRQLPPPSVSEAICRVGKMKY